MNSGRAASLFAALAAVYLVCVIALGFVASVLSKFLPWPPNKSLERSAGRVFL
jgi:hypothetical protein